MAPLKGVRVTAAHPERLMACLLSVGVIGERAGARAHTHTHARTGACREDAVAVEGWV